MMTSSASPWPEDRISDLPQPIIHSILSLLPIKDAGRTTVLSKPWAHHFPSIPDLRLDSSDEEDRFAWIDSIYVILANRTAPINSVDIFTKHFSQFQDEFHYFLGSLCRLRIKSLTLWNTKKHFLIPSCIFSCRTLTYLELDRCILSVPDKVAGLRKLRTLYLTETKVKDHQLENLVASCSALEGLAIQHCYRLRNVVIRSKKLSVLEIYGHRRIDVCIVNAPCLKKVVIFFNFITANVYNAINERDSDEELDLGASYSTTDDLDYDGILQGFANVQSLNLYIYAEDTTHSWDSVPIPANSRLSTLKTLTLNLDLNVSTYIWLLSRLLLSSPMLSELLIASEDFKGFVVNADCWGEHPIPQCLVNQLKVVKLIVNFDYKKYWIEFAKFILKNASVLEQMMIYHTYSSWDQSEADKIMDELMLIPKASVDVVLVVAPPDACIPYF